VAETAPQVKDVDQVDVALDQGAVLVLAVGQVLVDPGATVRRKTGTAFGKGDQLAGWKPVNNFFI